MIITPKNVLHVALNATMRCNLRCTYCYVHSDCLSTQFDMTDDDFTSLYKWIADYSVLIGASEIHFLWFGGEPLLISDSFIEKQILKQITLFLSFLFEEPKKYRKYKKHTNSCDSGG